MLLFNLWLACGFFPVLEHFFSPRFKDTIANTIGHRATERSLQLGLLYSASDALKIGIVDELVPEEKVLNAAAATMSQWLAIPGKKLFSLRYSCCSYSSRNA